MAWIDHSPTRRNVSGSIPGPANSAYEYPNYMVSYWELVISIGYGALTQQSISLVKRNRKGDWLSRCTADTKSSRLLTYVVGFNIRRLQIKHSFAVIISILHATYRNIKADSPQRFNVFFYYCIDKTDVRVCGKSICFIKVLVSEIQSSFIIGRGDALLLLSLWICWTLKNLITC